MEHYQDESHARNLAPAFRSGVLTPHTVATTIESERTDSRWRPEVKKISPRRTRAYAATTLSVVLVTAACGGENNADPPATSAAVPNTTPSTILPPTTDPAPTTTDPAPTTTPTVPTPPTAIELSEEEQAKQAVIEAAERTWRLYNEAILDPTNDAKFAAVQAAMSGEALAIATQIIESYRTNDQRAVSSTIVPASIDIDPDSIQLSASNDVATLEFCRVGSNVLVQTAGNADGADLVLDDTINAYSERETYELQSGVWVNTDGEVLRKIDGATSCDVDG